MCDTIPVKKPEMERKSITLSRLMPKDAEKINATIHEILVENALAYGIDSGDFSMMLTALTIEVATPKK